MELEKIIGVTGKRQINNLSAKEELARVTAQIEKNKELDRRNN